MLSIEKKVKNRILISILIILTITGITIITYENHLLKSHIERDITFQNKNINKTFNLLVNELDKNILERTNHILRNKEILKSFYNKDRLKLFHILNSDFTEILNNNKYLKTMTFRLADGEAFLRMHNPKKYGDKLDKKRAIVINAILTQKREYGFEVGNSKMTHSIITPIFYNKQFIGVLEIGIEPEYIIDKMNKIFNLESSLFVKNKDLELSLQKIGPNYKYSINDFIFIRGSEVVKENLERLTFNDKVSKVFYKGDDYYIDTIELFDYEGNVSAKMLISYNLDNYKKEFDELIVKNLVITFFVIIILFLVLNVGLNYFLKKIDKLYLNILKKDEMLLHQSKLASMGEMIGNIAHQWRQPLSVISTSASGLRLQNELGVLTDTEISNSVDGIVNSTKYLSQTIDDFMDFVKNDKKAAIFNIKKNIERNLEIVKGNLKIHQIKVIEECKNQEIVGFPNELTQVFINIIHNAKDAFKEHNIKDRFIFISSEENSKNQLVLKIRDNANGIPDNIIGKVFDPYFTTKKDSNGTGLGLYMSYRIINESMKGQINVENVEYNYEGKNYIGAEFTIALPKDNIKCQGA